MAGSVAGERMDHAVNWPPQQDHALRTVSTWMRTPSAPQVLYLAGYAGTGKSTLAKHLVMGAKQRWLFGAYTGKAAYVMRQKGCADVATLHSLIYAPAGESKGSEIAALEERLTGETDAAKRDAIIQQLREMRAASQPVFSLWDHGSPLAHPDCAGIVVDEVSMVGEDLGRDLETFGKKILVLGDPFQLPPVRGSGYFTARDPDVLLTEIHRQARDSGVLRLATHIRGGGDVATFDSAPDALITRAPRVHGRRAISKADLAERALAADQVLVGLNKTRHALNRRIRELKGRTSELPCAEDRVICLRNDREAGLLNGSQWIVTEADCAAGAPTADLALRSDDEDDDRTFRGEAWLHYFRGRGEDIAAMGQGRRRHAEFDYAEAITCHKAQGSQYKRVLVIDESRSFRADARRWLYTATTRAANHVEVLT